MMHRTVHDIVGRFEIEGLPGDRAVLCFEQFPSLNFVEDLEEEGPENEFSRIGRSRAVILDFTDQVLADAVGRAKAVGEPIGSQDRIVCPRTIGLGEPAEIHGEPFRSEEQTSELQSLMRISYAVFCLKKKENKTNLSNLCRYHY